MSKTIKYTHLASLLKKILVKFELTQNELAVIADADYTLISRCVNGLRPLGRQNCIKIMKYTKKRGLSLSLDDFFKDEMR